MAQRIEQGISIAALAAFDEDDFIEIVDGELEHKAMAAGFVHIHVINNLYDLLKPIVRAQQLGQVFGDGLTYVLHIDARGVRASRIPDFSFVRRDALPEAFDVHLPLVAVPALAVEVVSPTETPAKLMRKISDYLRYGSEQVWALYPIQRELHQYLQMQLPPRVYQAHEQFDASALFPGVSFKVESLFAVDTN